MKDDEINCTKTGFLNQKPHRYLMETKVHLGQKFWLLLHLCEPRADVMGCIRDEEAMPCR